MFQDQEEVRNVIHHMTDEHSECAHGVPKVFQRLMGQLSIEIWSYQ
jgi:hypothetical protein